MRRFTVTRLALLAGLVIGVTACSRDPLLVEGPIVVTERPAEFRFVQPVDADGSMWELCFEFDLPGDSHHAGAMQAALLSTAGERVALGQPTLDRLGEATVCRHARLESPSAGAHPFAFRGVELSSDPAVRLRAIRGGAHR